MKTYTAKQFANIPEWQATAQAKQAKKQAKQQRQQRNSKRVQWEHIE